MGLRDVVKLELRLGAMVFASDMQPHFLRLAHTPTPPHFGLCNRLISYADFSISATENGVPS